MECVYKKKLRLVVEMLCKSKVILHDVHPYPHRRSSPHCSGSRPWRCYELRDRWHHIPRVLHTATLNFGLQLSTDISQV